MAEILIQFNEPILQLGERFVVSYEDLDTGIVTNLPDKYDNDDLHIDLPVGRYRFTTDLVKAADTECPPRHTDSEVFPEPEEAPTDPPLDQPVTNPDPCICPT